MRVVPYKGRAFAPDQAEIASDDAPAVTDVTLSASMLPVVPRRDVERIGDRTAPRLTRVLTDRLRFSGRGRRMHLGHLRGRSIEMRASDSP